MAEYENIENQDSHHRQAYKTLPTQIDLKKGPSNRFRDD